MQFRITYLDGRTEELKAVPSALLAYEQTFDGPVGAQVASGRNEWAYWLCWKTKQVRDNETRGFEEWLTTCDDIVLALPFKAELTAIANRAGPRRLDSGATTAPLDPWLWEKLSALLAEWDAADSDEEGDSAGPPIGGSVTA